MKIINRKELNKQHRSAMFFSSILYKGVSDILKTGIQTYFFKIV